MDVLLSIKPKYVREIVTGEKKFEYRKRLFKKVPDKIFIYSSSPVKKIVGYFSYSGHLSGTPTDIWNSTRQAAGIKEIEYLSYYIDKSIAHAIIICDPIFFVVPIDPYLLNTDFRPPQSFMYIGEKYKYEYNCNMV